MGFSEKQAAALQRGLNAAHIRTRELSGRTLSYIEGWHAIAEANRIFGFDGWNRETVETRCVLSRDHRGTSFQAVYLAKVRITVQAQGDTVVREGYGSGEAHGTSTGEVHERAIKTAETDATKRALATFGRPFGLSLYVSARKSQQPHAALKQDAQPTVENRLPGSVPIPEHERRRTRQQLQPNGRYGTVKRKPMVLDPAFEAVRQGGAPSPSGVSNGGSEPGGRHDEHGHCEPGHDAQGHGANGHRANGYGQGGGDGHGLTGLSLSPVPADHLVPSEPLVSPPAAIPLARLQDVTGQVSGEAVMSSSEVQPLQTDVMTVAEQSSEARSDAGAAGASQSGPLLTADAAPPLQPEARSDDTAAKAAEARLLIEWPTRRREPEHLKYVQTQPCLLCGRAPSDAHHLRFAQRGALGRKVSDEFTVPLCRIHHRQLHDAGKEVDWWAAVDKDVDPLRIARALWEESRAKFNRALEP